MLKRLPHLKKNRYGVYCFRLIFTQSVRCLPHAPQEISLSLETRDFVIAQERYMLLYPHARAFRWSLHESVMKGEIDVSTLQLHIAHWKEKNRLRELLAAKNDDLYQTQLALLHHQKDNCELAAHAARMRDSNQRLKGALKSAKVMMTSASLSTESPFTSYKGVVIKDAPPSSREVVIEDAIVATTLPETVLPDATERTLSAPSVKSTKATSPSKPRARKRPSKSETLFAYVEKFIAHEAECSINHNPGESRRNYLMRFLDIVGYDIALASLKADDIRHYREMIHGIPANFDKQGFKVPRARSQRPQWFKDTIANWTGKTLGGGIDSHFKHVRMFLTWAHNEHYIEHNFVPMLKMSAKRHQETKKETVNFLPPDLKKLFIDGYLYGDSLIARESGEAWKFWVPLIGLYTGMRSEEIGILSLNHLIQQEGFWCIQIPNKAKTSAGVRTFPIPERLLTAGLLKYRQQIIDANPDDPNARLFPDLPAKGRTYSNRIGQFFNRNKNGTLKDGATRYEGYLHHCEVSNPSEKESFCFHSFRHGFITLMHETKLPDSEQRLALDLLKNLVGHKGDFKKYGIAAETWDDVTKMTYNHHERVPLMAIRERFTLMKQAMDAMDFGVDLSGISYERFLARK